MRFFIQTFGCQMNMADSNEMGAHLLERGWTHASDKEQADVVLLNTCTVRQHAEHRALSFIGRLKPWKKKNSNRVLIVTGCAAERLKKSLKNRFPFVDLVVGAKSIDEFPDLVNSFLKEKSRSKIFYDWFRESERAFGIGTLRQDGPAMSLGTSERTAFVTIMRGCNYSCSYCIVPHVRGREVYRAPEVILKEIQKQIAQGMSDVMLLGQTVNSYWHKTANPQKNLFDFSDLIQAVNEIEGVRSIRFMSPHPHYMRERLIQTLKSCGKVSPQIHLPVQSGSDKVLKLMNRNYSREDYISIANNLRQAIPNLKLTTDFIVGFPQETEEDFQLSLSLADEVSFEDAYCFKYSPRQGTESFKMADDIPQSVKEDRLGRLANKLEAHV